MAAPGYIEHKKCRRCERYFTPRQVTRTADSAWICLLCQSKDEEIAKKAQKSQKGK